LERVFKHVTECGATATIIVPVWVSALWWPVLLEKTHAHLVLPEPEDLHPFSEREVGTSKKPKLEIHGSLAKAGK
jgi:hypothetical protein